MTRLYLEILKSFDEAIVFPMRFEFLANVLAPQLKGCKKVLDVGCSCGRLSKKISEKLKSTEFTGTDVKLPSKTCIPVKQIKRDKLPFKNNSFDCVMLIDVLHHCDCPEKIIKESKRVSKKYVLIKDHYWTNKLDFAYLKFGDYIGNKPYGINLPYRFLRLSQWKNLFKENKMEVVYQKKFRTCYVGLKDIIFKLKK